MNQMINASNAPKAIGPYNHAVLSSKGTLYVSGQLGIDPLTQKLRTSVEAQTKQALANLEVILHEAKMTRRSVVKTTIYLTDMNDFKVVNEIYGAFFTTHPPARVCIGVKELPMQAVVEIDAICE